MTSEEDKKNVSVEVGPVSLDFEVPMYVCSGLAIRFLRVLERGRNYVPFRWVRYITHRYHHLTVSLYMLLINVVFRQ